MKLDECRLAYDLCANTHVELNWPDLIESKFNSKRRFRTQQASSSQAYRERERESIVTVDEPEKQLNLSLAGDSQIIHP